MKAMAALMRTALESPAGLRSMAAAIAKPIEDDITVKECASLLLTEHDLPAGERAIYQKRERQRAYFIARGGDAVESVINGELVEVPTYRLHANPVVDVSTLKNGNIGSLQDVLKDTANAITRTLNKQAYTLVSAAVPEANTVRISGGVLTETALNLAISKLEDQELAVRLIVMRGARFNNLRGWTTLDQFGKQELREKGVLANWGTGKILCTSAALTGEILILPDLEIGKMPIQERMASEPDNEPKRFKTGWVVWTERGFAVTRPDLIAKIVITS